MSVVSVALNCIPIWFARHRRSQVSEVGLAFEESYASFLWAFCFLPPSPLPDWMVKHVQLFSRMNWIKRWILNFTFGTLAERNAKMVDLSLLLVFTLAFMQAKHKSRTKMGLRKDLFRRYILWCTSKNGWLQRLPLNLGLRKKKVMDF